MVKVVNLQRAFRASRAYSTEATGADYFTLQCAKALASLKSASGPFPF